VKPPKGAYHVWTAPFMQGLNWCLNRNVQPNKISPELIYEANTEPPPAKAGGGSVTVTYFGDKI